MNESRKPILVIDDEVQIRKFLKTALEPHGFEVIEADSAAAGLIQATAKRPEIIILDLGLPDADGLAVLRRLREWYTYPIIILSVRDDEESIVAALDTGADDYLTKPFGLGELLARIRLAIRKIPGGATPTFTVGAIEIDIANRKVTRAGAELRLTTTEFSLLSVLAKHAGKVMTHTQILKAIWGPNSSEHVQYIRVYIGHLRHKIEDDPTPAKVNYHRTWGWLSP